MPNFKLLVTNDWERARAKTLYSKEPETIAWIDGFSEIKGVFWDIGANIGLYSLYCASNYPDMVIHSFEPHKANFLRLWQNILNNDYINITAYYAVFGREHKTACFDGGNPAIGSSGGQAGASGYPISMITGDWLAKRSDAVPNYIKIDTDGNEYDIIKGMGAILSDDRLRSVLVEVNNHELEIIGIMDAAGLLIDEKLMTRKNRESDHNIIFTRS